MPCYDTISCIKIDDDDDDDAYQEKRCSLLDCLGKEYRIKISRMSPNKIFMFLINPRGIIKLGSCPKHGTKIEDVLAIFLVLKQGQGSKSSAAHPYANISQVALPPAPPPPPHTHTHLPPRAAYRLLAVRLFS